MLFLCAALLIIGFLFNILISVKAHITTKQSDIWLNLRFFFMLIRKRVHLRFYSVRGEKLRLVRVDNKGKEKLIFPKEGRESAFLNSVKKQVKKKGISFFAGLKKAAVYTRTGTGSPDVAVFVCSAIKTLTEIFLLYLFPHNADNYSVSVRPDFDRKCFILNLECIFSACAVKIILIIIKSIFAIEPEGERK